MVACCASSGGGGQRRRRRRREREGKEVEGGNKNKNKRMAPHRAKRQSETLTGFLYKIKRAGTGVVARRTVC